MPHIYDRGVSVKKKKSKLCEVILRDIDRGVKDQYKVACMIKGTTMKDDIIEHMKRTVRRENRV